MFREIAGMVVAIAVPLTATAADKPEGLQRIGPWTVDYDRDSCHLLARFGTGNDETLIRFTRYAPEDKFELGLYRKRLWTRGTMRTETKINFGLESELAYPLNGETGAMQALLFGSRRIDGWSPKKYSDEPPPISREQEARVTGFTFTMKGWSPARLEFGSLTKPFAQLRDCMTNLVKSWGYDPAVQAALSRKVTPATPPQQWITDRDYPRNASPTGGSIVQFRLDVDEGGKVADCFILARGGPTEFTKLTCGLLRQRAKLNVALDAQGKPIRSFYISTVFWM